MDFPAPFCCVSTHWGAAHFWRSTVVEFFFFSFPLLLKGNRCGGFAVVIWLVLINVIGYKLKINCFSPPVRRTEIEF